MSTQLKISYEVESTVELTDAAKTFILEVLANVQNGKTPADKAPPGFVEAASKITDDLSEEQVLVILFGEVTSQVISVEVPNFYPPEAYGFQAAFTKVSYQETPAKLPPPEGTNVIVIDRRLKAAE
jgi:hypothetical protein